MMGLRVDWFAVAAGVGMGLTVVAISRLIGGPDSPVIGGALVAAAMGGSIMTLRRASRSS